MGSQLQIKSQPYPVQWCGWRSDTYTLSRAGWTFAVEEDPDWDRIRLMMYHEDTRLVAVTDAHSWHETYATTLRGGPQGMMDPHNFNKIVFNVVQITTQPRVILNTVGGIDPAVGFSLIDPVPSRGMIEEVDFDAMSIFRAAGGEATEVLMDKADLTVVEHLEAIKALQSERQLELRQKARRSQRVEDAPQRTTVANIIQLVA